MSDRFNEKTGWLFGGNTRDLLPTEAKRLVEKLYRWPVTWGYALRNQFLHGQVPRDSDYEPSFDLKLNEAYLEKVHKEAKEKMPKGMNTDMPSLGNDLIKLIEWCEPQIDEAHAITLESLRASFELEKRRVLLM